MCIIPIIKKERFLTLAVTAVNREGLLEELMNIFDARKLMVSDLSSHEDLVTNELFYQMVLTQQKQRIGHELTDVIKQLEGIKKIHYR